jgi:hypothetical protein
MDREKERERKRDRDKEKLRVNIHRDINLRHNSCGAPCLNILT